MKKLIQLAIAFLVIPASAWADSDDPVTFDMLVSAGAHSCLPNARGTVRIIPVGSVEHMHVGVSGLPPNTEFELFVIQVPAAPFGLSTYLGSITTNHIGQGSQTFIGRFSNETFTVAVGSAPAPLVFNGPFPDATLNPPFNPIQQYHLGLWFGSPNTAAAAGCPAAITPFSGEHNAGIQVLNTKNFPDDHGPLRQVTSSL